MTMVIKPTKASVVLSLIFATFVGSLGSASIDVNASEKIESVTELPEENIEDWDLSTGEKEPVVCYEEFEIDSDEQEDCDTLYIASADERAYWTKMTSNYIYEHLSSEEKKAWDDITDACLSYLGGTSTSDRVKVGTTGYSFESLDAFVAFLEMYLKNNPQFFFVDRSRPAYSTKGDKFIPYICILEAFQDVDARQKAAVEFKNKINGWIEQINLCSNVVEKEKKAATIIACNTVYGESPNDQSSYSMVCEGRTVCAGYSGTYSLLMNAAGVDTVVISGYAGNASHAWNASNVYGNWYLVDPTWMDQNDNASEELKERNVSYYFLNRSDATMYQKRVRRDWGDLYCPEAKYDIGHDERYYRSPFLVKGDYQYIIVNNNAQLGPLYAGVVSRKGGGAFGTIPKTIEYNHDVYNCCSIDVVTENESTGWRKNNNAWMYFSQTGEKATGWKQINNDWYYFDVNGAMLLDWQKIGQYWYYFGSEGNMHTGIQKISGKWYWLSDSGKMKTGWKAVPRTFSTKWYYFLPSGAMATGWTKINDKWYYFDCQRDSFADAMDYDYSTAYDKYEYAYGTMAEDYLELNGKTYYFGKDGKMRTGWVQLNGGGWRYFGTSGAQAFGWNKISNKWYYFDEYGIMRSDTWEYLGGRWYYFETSGAMVVGWKLIDNEWYYFESSGAQATSKWIDGLYYVKEDGTMATNEWIGKYYVDANGKWVPGKTK